jgi:hypothetical protein
LPDLYVVVQMFIDGIRQRFSESTWLATVYHQILVVEDELHALIVSSAFVTDPVLVQLIVYVVMILPLALLALPLLVLCCR